MVAPGGCLGGVHGCSRGRHAWLLGGGMHGCSWGACMVALGGVHGCSWGACVVAPGGVCVVSAGGHAWLLPGGHAWDTMRYGDTINEPAVRILLECILVVCNTLQRKFLDEFPDLSRSLLYFSLDF